MRLALIFPPSMPPTSPPCGIAYLKAYVGSCKSFDLNLHYHELAVKMLKEEKLPVEADIRGYVLEPDQLMEAVHVLKGKRKTFYNQNEYNRNISIIGTYFSKIDSYIREECMRYLFEDSASDEALQFFDELLSPITDYHPDLVGFSHFIFSQREFILGLAKFLKTEDIPIIVGGASIAHNPESYLSEVGAKKIDLSEIFDAAFYGEGELPLTDYLEGKKLENIPNIVYKKNKIIKNEESGLADLDELPIPDFSDFFLKEYYAPETILPVLTSKGCYWMRCTFCTHYKSYYKYRTRSIEKVISDLKELQKRYKANYFLLADEMIHPKRFDDLSHSILQEGLNIRYYSEVKPTRHFTAELLKKMHDSGVRALLWGVESGTQRILDLIDKGTHVADVEKVLKESHEAGIWNLIFLIVGYPTQTEEEAENDLAFLKRNKSCIGALGKSLFQLVVGSRIYEHPENFGIKNVEKDQDPFSDVCSYEVTEGLSKKEAKIFYEKHRSEYMRFYRMSPYFGRLRDHMLLFADHTSKNPLQVDR